MLENLSDRELFWLIGILEGEGSFSKPSPSRPNSVIISMTTTDEDIAHRVATYFERKYRTEKKRQEHWKQSYVVRLTGYKAADVMRKIKPFMSIRRQTQINAALSMFSEEHKNKIRENAIKLPEHIIEYVQARINDGESLRGLARQLQVPHETLRRKIKERSFSQV